MTAAPLLEQVEELIRTFRALTASDRALALKLVLALAKAERLGGER